MGVEQVVSVGVLVVNVVNFFRFFADFGLEFSFIFGVFFDGAKDGFSAAVVFHETGFVFEHGSEFSD